MKKLEIKVELNNQGEITMENIGEDIAELKKKYTEGVDSK